MELKYHSSNSGIIAEVIAPEETIGETGDFLDLMADASYNEAGGLIIRQKDIHPDFFDLSTGMAGEILQKFSTYRMKLAIVGDFSEFGSKSLKDFIRESNRNGHILFLPTIEDALVRM
jgi:hypothetical protein